MRDSVPTHLTSAVLMAEFYGGEGLNAIFVINLQPHVPSAFLSFSPPKLWDNPWFNALFSFPVVALVQS